MCAVLFLSIAAGPLLLELLLDRFAEATLNSPTQPLEIPRLLLGNLKLKVVSGLSLFLQGLEEAGLGVHPCGV